MTNKNRTTIYIGVTSNLIRRIIEHKNHLNKNSFSDKYNLEFCIYFEEFSSMNLAINREKELKNWNREKKESLINQKNPDWRELVSEKGFLIKNKSFQEQVQEFLNEYRKISPSSE